MPSILLTMDRTLLPPGVMGLGVMGLGVMGLSGVCGLAKRVLKVSLGVVGLSVGVTANYCCCMIFCCSA